MLSDVLPHLNRLSKIFQKTNIDLSLVDSMVAATQMTLQQLLNQYGDHMTKLPDLFQTLEEYGVKNNTEAVDKFKDQVYHQYISQVIENLHNRFPDTATLDAFSVFDPDLVCSDDPTLNEYIHFNKLQTLADQFPSVGTAEAAKEEFRSLRNIIASKKDQLNYTQTVKLIAAMDTYPTLSRYAQILLILPMSTADCERSFSTLSRIKTCLRNRLSQKILNCLLTISIEGPDLANFDFNMCVSSFGKTKKRKLDTE